MASEAHRLDAERDYLSGGVSYADLAKRYRVSTRTVERWGAAGNWDGRRRAVVGAVSAELAATVTAAVIDEAAEATRQHLAGWARAREKFLELLDALESARDAKDWAQAWRTMQTGQREALGLAAPKPGDAGKQDDGQQPTGVVELPALAPVPEPPADG